MSRLGRLATLLATDIVNCAEEGAVSGKPDAAAGAFCGRE
jgi:hypothetical protein